MNYAGLAHKHPVGNWNSCMVIAIRQAIADKVQMLIGVRAEVLSKQGTYVTLHQQRLFREVYDTGAAD